MTHISLHITTGGKRETGKMWEAERVCREKKKDKQRGGSEKEEDGRGENRESSKKEKKRANRELRNIYRRLESDVKK